MKREDAIFEKITQIWNAWPDMRFGQLLGNFVFDRVEGNYYWLDFTATDEQVEDRLKGIIKQYLKPKEEVKL